MLFRASGLGPAVRRLLFTMPWATGIALLAAMLRALGLSSLIVDCSVILPFTKLPSGPSAWLRARVFFFSVGERSLIVWGLSLPCSSVQCGAVLLVSGFVDE